MGMALPNTGGTGGEAATDADIDAAIAALVGGAPDSLDTLNELAASIADDPAFAASVAASLALLPTIANGAAPDDEISWLEDGDELRALLRNVPRTVGVNSGLAAGVGNVPATPTSLLSATLTPVAGLLAAGDQVEWEAWGSLANTSGAPTNFTWELVAGSTAILSTGAVSVTNSALGRFWRLRGVFRCTSTSGGQYAFGTGIFRLSQPGGGASLALDIEIGQAAPIVVNFAAPPAFDLRITEGTQASTQLAICYGIRLIRHRNVVA